MCLVMRRRAGLRRADEGQGHDQHSILLLIQQCSAILLVSRSVRMTHALDMKYILSDLTALIL
jgi:hypothetical protein